MINYLRWVFTLFGAISANSNLYKKTIFEEIPTKAIYQYEERLFCNTPNNYLTETAFPFCNIPLEKDDIVKHGNKIVFKKGNRYTCNNTCKSLFMNMLCTSANLN